MQSCHTFVTTLYKQAAIAGHTAAIVDSLTKSLKMITPQYDELTAVEAAVLCTALSSLALVILAAVV